MMTRAAAIAALIFVALLSAAAARAEDPEKRVALVVGVSKYQHVGELPNSTNDANALGDTLARLGFEVVKALDPDKRSLERTLRDFGDKAAQADVALIYYAGHGIQVDGRNYLIPADARLEQVRDLPYDAVDLGLFLAAISDVKKAGVMIVDACRDNPFVQQLSLREGGSARIGRGLSRIDDAPSRTLIAMSTRANAVAEDGADDHSPYAQALLAELSEPGVELRLFFGRVADRVKAATNGRQEPYISGTLGGTPVYLHPRPQNRPPAVAQNAPLAIPDTAGITPLGIRAPLDPDGDRLSVEVTALPRGGRVRAGGRPLLTGDRLAIDQLTAATFEPDGTSIGDAGSFEYDVTDDRGGTAHGMLAISIVASNNPPVVAADSLLRAVRNPLGIKPPIDPDGDAMTITVTGVPRQGKVWSGTRTLGVGDHLNVDALANLTYEPGGAPPGPAGSFEYEVKDDRGAAVASRVSIEVWDAASPPVIAEATPPTPPPEPPIGSNPPPTPTPPPTGTKQATVIADSNLRSGPTASSKKLDRVAKGSVVEVLERDAGSNWLKVATSSGKTGYLAGDRLKLPENSPESVEPKPSEPQPPASLVQNQPEPPPATSGDSKQAPVVRSGSGEGDRFADCDPGCPEMVRIPSGSFEMGSNGEASERPVHPVNVKGFAIGRREITVGEWRACSDGGGCPSVSEANASDAPDAPMHNLSWDDATAYVTWLSKKTGKPYRLPSESEWEFAARAGTTGPYWWGSKIDAQFVSCKDCGGPYDKLAPPTRGVQPNPFGLVNVSGGVAEWVMDCWKPSYDGVPSDGTAREGNCGERVLRGGSWRDDHSRVTVTSRGKYDHDVRYLNNGFRVVRDLD